MIATLVREAAERTAAALMPRATRRWSISRWSDQGQCRTEPPSTLRWVVAATADTSLHDAVFARNGHRLAPCRGTGGRPVQRQAAMAAGAGRAAASPSAGATSAAGGLRRGSFCMQLAVAAGLLRGCGWLRAARGSLGYLALFLQVGHLVCSCPAAFHRPPGECCPDRPFRKRSHQVEQRHHQAARFTKAAATRGTRLKPNARAHHGSARGAAHHDGEDFNGISHNPHAATKAPAHTHYGSKHAAHWGTRPR